MIDPVLPFCEPLPEKWTRALIERTRFNGERARRWEIIDLDPVAERLNGGNLRYPCESTRHIRAKCALASVGLPLYTMAYMVWHSVRTPLSSLYVFFQRFEIFITHPSKNVLLQIFLQPLKQLFGGLWLVARAPFYMIAMQSAALYGVVRPLEGRKQCGAVERLWKRGASFRQDFRNLSSNEDLRSFFWRACTSKDFEHPFYFAQCFQPYGTLNDPSVVLVRFSSDLECSP